MKATVKIRDLIMGQGAPKICVPMTSATTSELIGEVNEIRKSRADIIEWRVDYFEGVKDLDKVRAAAAEIRKAMGEMPLLFTFRSKKEGGELEISKEAYMELNRCAATSGCVDAIDVELFSGDDECRHMVEMAHDHGVKVIMSSHDFDKTPSGEEIEKRLTRMKDLNADIPKIALMPNTPEDVVTVLAATARTSEKLAKDCPIITMSMGALGAVSRISGEALGSCMTFGTVKRASAPGQMETEQLHNMLLAVRLAN